MKLAFGQSEGGLGAGFRITDERYDLLLRLSVYKVFRDNFEWKLSEQDVISKVMIASLKQLK